MAKKPVITAAEAAAMVKDGMTISTSGFVASAMPEALTRALAVSYTHLTLPTIA